MTNSPYFWLTLNIGCILVQGFYSMMEMACVSFNKVRLHYYLTKNYKKANYINFLIRRPYRLFGTVMLGANIALQLGSEASRECYAGFGISPDYAPLTQVCIVVIFAELLPLTISRKMPERLALWGAPILYYSHYLFYPFIRFIGVLTEIIYYFLGIKKDKLSSTLSRDELQKVLETHNKEHEFNVIATNIFSLSTTNAGEVMTPLSQHPMLPATSNVSDLVRTLRSHSIDFVPVYHKEKSNIIGIAFPKDFINSPTSELLKNHLHSPWFITEKTKLIRILKEFRANKRNVALVLGASGEALGLLSLNSIFQTIFNTSDIARRKPEASRVIERTIPGNTRLVDLRKELGLPLTRYGCETIAQLVMQLLDAPAEEGSSVIIDNLLLEVKETTLSGIKSVVIKNLFS
ncbi:CNNM domain-containing protein [Chlamydiifrater phoenicopteri]|uniref:CNNM domain-containing protein n=1 Tax=Chlamydiifrater phoenicopteri TaxID=2681469 RepID=UPI001BCE2573|nr:hemolysin family protein [Chlamydiifrater phoenicopteri]